MVLRILGFLRSVHEQRNESGFLAILVHAVEMPEKKQRPHKRTWRKAFIAIYVLTDTVSVNAAGTYLQTYGRILPQAKQMLCPNMSTLDFSAEILKELIYGTWRWRVQSPTSANFSSVVKKFSLSKLQI